MDITQPSVILRASQSCNINTVAITHGRNDSTLRDHPDAVSVILHRRIKPEALPCCVVLTAHDPASKKGGAIECKTCVVQHRFEHTTLPTKKAVASAGPTSHLSPGTHSNNDMKMKGPTVQLSELNVVTSHMMIDAFLMAGRARRLA